MSKCIITGCRFVIAAEGKSIWGDLHSVSGEIAVFGGVTIPGDVGKRACWEYVYPSADKDEKQATLISGADYFERRGIITCRIVDVELNDASKKHLGDR